MSRTRTEDHVILLCDQEAGGCGCDFEVSFSWARQIRGGKYPRLCRRCRRRAMRIGVPAPITDRDRQFWIDRFGRQGAIELGQAIWPSTPVAEPARFAASAAPQA